MQLNWRASVAPTPISFRALVHLRPRVRGYEPLLVPNAPDPRRLSLVFGSYC